jgi:hypothetical protein
MRKDAISSCARGNEMSLFGSKQKTPNKGEAIAKLRLDLAGAVSSARQAGIDSREIANILEQHVDIWRQNDAMMRPVL